MPPHFDGLWFVTDVIKNTIDTMRVDANGVPHGYGRVFSNLKVNRPTDFKTGPDGAFYIMNYAGNYNTVDATAIVRIEYTGTCRPEVTVPISAPSARILRPDALRIQGPLVRIDLDTKAELRVWDMNGKVWLAEKVGGIAEFDLRRILGRPGLYGVTLSSDRGALVKKILVAPQ
jgi:hypothetical protein